MYFLSRVDQNVVLGQKKKKKCAKGLKETVLFCQCLKMFEKEKIFEKVRDNAFC